MHAHSAAFSLSLCLGLASSVHGAQSSAQDLGQPNGTVPGSLQISDLSADGRTAVGSAYAGAGAAAFRWSEAGGYELLQGQTAQGATAAFVSGDGTFVAGTDALGSVVRWDGQGQLEVAARGFLGLRTILRGMSGDGSTVIGSYLMPQHGDQTGFVWTRATGAVAVGSAAMPRVILSSVSFDGGTVAATGGGQFGGWTGHIWTAGAGMVDVGAPASPTPMELALSADGQVLFGSFQDAAGSAQLFRWTPAGGYVPIGAPQGNLITSLSASQDGSTAAGILFVAPATVRGFRWTTASGFQQLGMPNGDDFLPTDISSDGQVLAGYALSSAGRTEPTRWVATTGYRRLGFASVNLGDVNVYVDRSGTVAAATVPDGSFSLRRGLLWRADGTLGETGCTASAPNSTGLPGTLVLRGSNTIAEGAMELEASNLPPQSFGFFIASSAAGFAARPGGSQGDLCLGGSIGRFVGPGQIQQASASGQITLTVGPGSLPSPLGPVSPPPGERWYFQAWHRDANPGPASNFTGSATVRIY